MSTARRGITDHALVETIESVYIAADPAILARREIDRLAVVFAMMRDPRCTAAEAVEAADRLFPIQPGGHGGASIGLGEGPSLTPPGAPR